MFITFEGIEGSGKTLQIQRAEAFLRAKGLPCLLTREPGGTGFGLAVRRVLLETRGPEREPMSELLLYLADRYQHLHERIEPALRRGEIVLSDRYHDATRAYQSGARCLPAEIVELLARILGIPEPDHTILLDIEPEVGLARARLRNDIEGSAGDEGRFEAEDLSFHRDVRSSYLTLAERSGGRIHVIDGAGSPDEVFERVRPLLEIWSREGR